MACRSTNLVSSFLLGAVLGAVVAAPAAAAPKEPERITQGTGPATLTAPERAKAVAHGIVVSATTPGVVRIAPAPAVVERRPVLGKPADTGTRLPSLGARDRRKPGGLGPVDAAKTGARP